MNIYNSWQTIISNNYGVAKLKSIFDRVEEKRRISTVYPPKDQVFNFLNFTDFDQVKVVIIGQDPYFNKGEANGLAFSVNEGIKIPPSLRNIYKELSSDLGITPPISGELVGWAKQGVFLINSTLTVEEKLPNSHIGVGWSDFTDFLIKYLSDNREHLVFVLWGNFAKKKINLIDQTKHCVISTSHPSPLSARHSFFGSKVFSRINNYLIQHSTEPIDWSKNNDY